MKNKPYDEMIDRLSRIKPAPASATRLTDNILNGIEALSPKKQMYITLRANEKQWTLFNRLRAVLTIAAVFLIGFLILQQWEINHKLSRLEKVLATPYQYDNTSFNEQGRNERLQRVLYELRLTTANPNNDSKEIDVLQINRRSLNYMLEAIQELRKENLSYREKLQQYYSDSTSYKH
jgi:hypothetical protein